MNGYGLTVVMDFRGLFAPASLKQVRRDPIVIDIENFRGLFAPASLKHAGAPLSSLRNHHFRGLFAPASLKLKPVPRVFDRALTSGASSPRPH